MGFIEDLYYGNIRPIEKCFNQGTQYEKAIKQFCRNEQLLAEILSEEKLKLFNSLIDANDEIRAINDLENFKFGFRLGVQMICNSIFYNDNEIFRDID